MTYAERKQARIDRCAELAEKNKEKSTIFSDMAHKSLSLIPMGQPILIGHHSEKGHRAHLKRIDGQFKKAVESNDKAAYYAQKAAAAENNTAISSDDPDAPEKLKQRIDELETTQTRMKAANKIVKSKKLTDDQKIEQLAPIVGQHKAPKLLLPDFCGRVGFPDYALQNNNANIRRLKERLEKVERIAKLRENAPNAENIAEIQIGNGIRIVQNAVENRTQVFFPDKPDENTRTALKAHGFRWSPLNGCWQRHMSTSAAEAAKTAILKTISQA